jgi:alkylhydroperoxidase/carboxymuconolactone decarboxylase family protein YurZ
MPPQIAVALREVPEALAGYLAIRQFVWSGDGNGDGLSKSTVNLIFTVLDVQTNNLYGAKNHARAALTAGLPWHHLMQALVQLWIVSGFASTWGTVGYELVQWLRDEGFGLDTNQKEHQ